MVINNNEKGPKLLSTLRRSYLIRILLMMTLIKIRPSNEIHHMKNKIQITYVKYAMEIAQWNSQDG